MRSSGSTTTSRKASRCGIRPATTTDRAPPPAGAGGCPPGGPRAPKKPAGGRKSVGDRVDGSFPTAQSRKTMTLNRRQFVQSLALASAGVVADTHAQAGTLKISHQFPGGSATEGDFRDRLCNRFASELQKRTNGALKAAVYPGSSLMKVNAQFSALRKGALDMSLVPLSYA